MTYEDFYLEFGPGGHWLKTFGEKPSSLIFSLLDLRELLFSLESFYPAFEGAMPTAQAIDQPVLILHGVSLFLDEDPYDEPDMGD
jgi:hypothetical protein